MIRLHSINIRGVSAASLPQAVAEGPIRMLFVNSNILGHRTQAALIREATANRPDVDAVHIDIERSWWAKLATASYRVPDGFDLPDYRYLKVYGAVVRRWLRGPLDVRRFDVVQFLTQGLAGAVLSPIPGMRAAVVLNIDSTVTADVREFGGNPWARRPFISAERALFRRADLVTALSEWAARSVTHDYDVASDKVAVVKNGVVIPPPSIATVRAGLPRIVFVGNDWRRKGGDALLAIHQRALAGQAELHVVSSAPKPPGTFVNVIWHGQVDRQRLTHELFPSMDLFAFPTRTDMSPFVVLEAAAAGLPVVATRIAAIPEMVIDGQTGVLTERGDDEGFAHALATLVADPARRAEMGRRGREHIRARYDSRAIYPAYIDRLVTLGRSRRDR